MPRFTGLSGLILVAAILGTASAAVPVSAQDAAGQTPSATPAPVPPPDSKAGSADQPVENPDVHSDEDFSVGDVPDVQTVELTPDLARRALDTYILVHDKYKDAELENYETLQEFVDQNAQGKAFEVDVKANGFASVDEWNVAVTTLGFAYSNIAENQTDDINQQIEELKADTELAQDMKDRMTKSLQAMIPSANNTKVVEELIKDPAYADKMKTFDSELDIQRE